MKKAKLPALPALPGNPDSLIAAAIRPKGRRPRSMMPPGATLSPKGDLGAFRGEEGLRAVPGMKAPGKTIHAAREIKSGRKYGHA